MNEKHCKWTLEVLTEIYVSIIILIFPLLIGPKGYENILEVKYYSYAFISVIYLISITFVLLYFLIFKKVNIIKQIKITKIHYCLFLFLLINILSYIFSPYKNYNLFLGLGRGEGLFNIILYTTTFLYISLFLKFDKKYLKYISLSVIFVSLIAILEYLGFNPFYIYKNNMGPFNMSYMTTLGNKDIISAYYTIMLSISFCSFVFLKNTKKETVLHLFSLFMGIFIFGIIEVDSGLFAFLLSIMIILPFLLLNNEYLSKTMLVGAISIFAFAINYIINPIYKYSDKIYHLEPQFDKYALLMLIVSILFVISFLYIKKNKFEVSAKNKFIKRVYMIYPIIIIMGLSTIYFKDFDIPIMSEAREILHGNFDDNLGTYRMFLWKRSIKLVKDYPILGTGPDTFSYRFMSKYWKDVIALDHRLTINDTAANVYLTTLINIGILGLISYLLFIISILKRLYNRIKQKDILALIFLEGITCFLIQDFFNLTVVIITPIFYTILGMAVSLIDNQNTKWYTKNNNIGVGSNE